MCGLFSSCLERGLLTVVVSLAVEHRLWDAQASVVGSRGLSGCSFWAQAQAQ